MVHFRVADSSSDSSFGHSFYLLTALGMDQPKLMDHAGIIVVVLLPINDPWPEQLVMGLRHYA